MILVLSLQHNMNICDLKQKAKDLVDISKLDYHFVNPPLLVSGVAMMYHGLRESDKDIDMILSAEDHRNYARQLKDTAKVLESDHGVGYKESPQFTDLYDDHGILVYEFELWDSIMRFTYEDLRENAIVEDDYIVISLEKLMMLSVIRGLDKERYLQDALLIAKLLRSKKYKGYVHERNAYWKNIL